MPRYLLAFHGGKPPKDQEQMADFMTRWRQWAGGLGSSLADEGAVLSRSMLVTDAHEGTAEPCDNRLTGYSLIDAGSLDEAIGMARGCPIFEVGGSIEVGELMDASMATGSSDKPRA